MTHQPETLALLRDTEHYLSALHGSVARHDNLAANYGCAGCELRDRIAAAVSAAVAPPTDQAALRDRIAQALMQWAESNNSTKYASMRRPATVVHNAYSRADAVLAELPSAGCLTPEYTDGPCHCPSCDPAAHRTDRAAFLADVERAIRTATRSCGYKAEDGCDFCNGVAAALDQVRRMADETATRSDVGTEFARQADQPDESGLAAWEGELTDETATQTPAPRRGDAFEQWLKAQRDAFGWQGANDRDLYDTLDGILDRYRLHADTGTPLGEHVCEGKAVGDCECLEQLAAGARQDGAET